MAQGLRQYIDGTLSKLEAKAPSPADLKSKVMPAVVSSIQNLSAGAPQEIRAQMKAVLVDNGVLPDYQADIAAFSAALSGLSDLIGKTVKEAAPKEAAPEAAPEEAPEPTPEPTPKDHVEEADVEEEAEEALAAEEPVEPEEAQGPEELHTVEEEDEEEIEEEEEDEEEIKQEEESPQAVAEPEAQKETPTPPTASTGGGPPTASTGGGRGAFRAYIENTLARLEGLGTPSAADLKSKIEPQVVETIKGMVGPAPQQVKDNIRQVLLDAKVLPHYSADVEALKGSLRGILDLLPGREGQQAAVTMAAAPAAIAAQAVEEPVDAPAQAVEEPVDALAQAVEVPVDAPVQEHTDDPSLGHRLRGVSVAFLSSNMLEEVKAAGLDRTAKVYEIEPTVIRPRGDTVTCPRDGRQGAAYVDCLNGSQAGMSTHMLSYTWGYTIGDIADSLVAFCSGNKLDPNRTFFWMCCLCINQHRVKEAQEKKETVPFEKFKDEFGDRVKSIGHVVAMMAPWKDPFYTKRVWCDFEMFTAANLSGEVCISITMPPREMSDMRKTVMSGTQASNPELWSALQNVKIEEAEASVQEDKDRIFRLIEDTIGFHSLNSTVAHCLQNWVATTCDEILEEIETDPSANPQEVARECAGIGYVLRDVGNTSRALDVLNRALELFKTSGQLSTAEGAILLSNLGATKRRSKDLEGAMQVFKRAKDIFEKTNTMNSKAGALFYNSLGAARREQGDLAGAFDAYETARHILEDIEEFRTTDGAMLMNSIGAARRQFGDLQGALEAFAESQVILEETGTLMTPPGQVLMNSIAATKKQMRDNHGALEAYKIGQKILEKMGTKESDNGAQLMTQIARTKRNMKDFTGAVEAFLAAKKIREKLHSLHTEEGQTLISELADAEDKAAGRQSTTSFNSFGKGSKGRGGGGGYPSDGYGGGGNYKGGGGSFRKSEGGGSGYYDGKGSKGSYGGSGKGSKGASDAPPTSSMRSPTNSKGSGGNLSRINSDYRRVESRSSWGKAWGKGGNAGEASGTTETPAP